MAMSHTGRHIAADNTNVALILEALAAGHQLLADIYKYCTARGMVVQKKYCCTYIRHLAVEGKIEKIDGTRPIKWKLVEEKPKPAIETGEPLSQELMVFMGYPICKPSGAKMVSPLTIFEAHEYSRPTTKHRKFVPGIQSSLASNIFMEG